MPTFKSLGIGNMDAHVLSIIKKQDDEVKMGLLSHISSEAGEKAVKIFRELVDPNKPHLTVAIVKAVNRLPFELHSDFNQDLFETSPYPEVKAYALTGLYGQDPKKYREIIFSWLDSSESTDRKTGVIAAGESGDGSFIPKLKEMLDQESEDEVLPFIIKGLHNLGAEGLKNAVLPYVIHPLESVRLAALETIDIEDDKDLRTVISLMDDSSERIHELAKEKIESASYHNALLLVESIAVPRRRVREGIFELLESLKISDVDIFRFAQSQLQRAYTHLEEAESLRSMPESRERDLLIDHLIQKKDLRLETILRVLATQDRSGQMRVIWRGIFSLDVRQRSNALEALEDSVGRSLTKGMIPLLEGLSPSDSLASGRKMFQLPHFDSNPRLLYFHLLENQDWVTVVLAIRLIGNQGFEGLDKRILERFLQEENPHVRQVAQMVIDGEPDNPQKERDMEASISVPDKIFHLRGIQIFEGLSVSELAAIASVTEEVVYPEGEIVIKEGEPGETMYMIISGEVSVIKGQEGGREIELDRINAGDYFGEMALFEDTVRSATIRTQTETKLLVLHKLEFNEIVREYPQIALYICKVLSRRLRRSHEIIQGYEKGQNRT